MNLALTQLGLVFVFVLARLLPLALLLPVVGGKVVPVRLRIALAMVVSIMIAPLFLSAFSSTQPTTLGIIVAVSREVLFGLGLALTVMILVGALQLAGSLITQVSGLTIVDSADPRLPLGATAIERFFALLSITIFLTIGGHRQLVEAILETFKRVPPGKPAPMIDSATLLIGLLTQSFELAIRAAAPVVFSLVVATVVVGLIARTLPQVGAFGFGLGINLALMLVMLWVSIETFPPLLENYVEHGLDSALQTMSAAESPEG